MKPVVATLLCLFTKVLQAQLEGFEVSGPIYVHSNRDPKVLGFQRIQYIDSLEEAEDTVEEGVKTAADFVSTNFQTAEKDVLAAVNSTERSISGKITGVSNSIKSTMSNVGDKVQQAASQSKIFILKSTESAEGYFSSAFKSVKDWFFQLETEAKELIHFVLRVIEVSAVLIILGLFVWIFQRVASGYRFVKGIAGSFEMDDLSSRRQTV